ncbi:uncharacterized protein LOC125236184 [Leguminivora glycinivorella]|uniref:uncharacterized protein LOC125236184 n=1 Tax=Leguminivora glycinivorella TaxID=1035111 RepID=UPI00200F2DE4|nr:uncharacterized protein LOC125236184 [Leguminivora glycinivorella]
MCCCRKRISYAIDWMIYWYLTRNDRKREKKVARLNKVTGIKNPILFRLIVTKSGVVNDMIRESRLAIRKKNTGDEPIYAEITQDVGEANRFSTELEERVRSNGHHRMGERAAHAAAAALAVQAAVQTTFACDKTLFLSSNGKICDLHVCKDVNMYSMSIATGSNICFKTVDGEKLEIKMGDAKHVTRYQAEYFSCDYKLSVTKTWRCKQLNSDCWNNGKCYDGYEHPDIQVTNTRKYPAGYGCNTDTLGCDDWCPMGTSCTWYRWQLEPVLNDCHKVYRKVSEIWQVSIYVKYTLASKETESLHNFYVVRCNFRNYNFFHRICNENSIPEYLALKRMIFHGNRSKI